ncbi:MAG: 16S rRNA (uracil(1498)-N(3))-methyltransferase [Nitrospirae bacterium]|nr:16S rRNA (uracil(1498)-N(3))-methyltransferase [Nitrospirota bacterium]
MRIFVPQEDIRKQEQIRLSADKSHYLISVIRCKKGDRIAIIDGKGKAYKAEVSEIAKRHVFINILHETPVDTESAINFILCQGILKGEKMDLVIQKTTELGVNGIMPLITERGVVKETRKAKRWQKIAEEAAEQCGRTVIPKVHEPVQFAEFFERERSRRAGVMEHWSNGKMTGFIFWEEGGMPLKESIKKISLTSLQHSGTPIFVFIGPEGGFTSEEIRLAEGHGLIRTTLGKRVLRAETAAIVSTALVQFLTESAFSSED